MRHTECFITLLISIACFLPELDLFDDGCLLPKWYLLIIVSCVLVIRGCTSGVNWQNKSAIRISVTYSIYYPLENPMNGEITWVLTPTSHDLQSSHSYSILSFLYNI